ncbi:site-specific integrase [Candidatus Berkelbacteria bacterium]|nr:site-specific integrase [Candidatus Berkelbacteria bacterium]
MLGLIPKEEVKPVLFKEAVASYLEHRLASGKSDRSYHHLRVPAKKGDHAGFWEKEFGDHPIGSLSTEQLEDALRKQARRRSWSTATCNRALAQLSGLFTYARRRRWVNEHPVERGRIPRAPEDNARTRWLRLHEIEAILERCPAWLAVIVRFAVSTGMRLGEVCSLTRAGYQVDQLGRAYVISERTKNGDRLFWPLEGWPRKYVEERVATSRFPGDYLFPGPEGGKASASIQRWLPDAIRAAGLNYGRKHPDGVTFHTFRHSMASLALNHGVPESTVQRMGNWKTRAMVQRYAHLADEELRSAAAKLADLVGQHNARKQEEEKGASKDGSDRNGAA